MGANKVAPRGLGPALTMAGMDAPVVSKDLAIRLRDIQGVAKVDVAPAGVLSRSGVPLTLPSLVACARVCSVGPDHCQWPRLHTLVKLSRCGKHGIRSSCRPISVTFS